MVAMTFQPGPKKPWIFEHFAGDSTISTDDMTNNPIVGMGNNFIAYR
jgi:hypothetical protein